MANTNSKVATAHVPLPLAEKVDQLAMRLERSRGWVVNEALSTWVTQEEDRHQMTVQALGDIDAGRVTDHDAVQAWAEGLSTSNPLPVPTQRE